MRCRVTSQRRLPGSHMPSARCRMWAKSCGQRSATMRPNSANSTGPMRAGRGGSERKGGSWSRAQSQDNRQGCHFAEYCPARDALESGTAVPGTQSPDRPRRRGQRLPAGDGPGALPRLRHVSDQRKQSAQLDGGRKLAFLLEGGADRGGFCLGDNEHAGRMGAHTDGGKRRLPPLTPVRSRVRQ